MTPPPEGSADPLPRFFAEKSWERATAADIGRAALVPTMLQFDEQAYYVALTRDWARGDGAIVDLGSFAGGSAACLAEGVAQAGRQQVVYGYDKFDVTDYDVFAERYRAYCASPPASECGLPPMPLPEPHGTDLLPVAAEFLRPWGQGIELRKGQIEDIGWPGGEIEVLVMDASKTAESMDQMSAQFLPHLIPGRSVVVQQDFLWWQQPWIAAQMALLRDYLVPLVHVPRDSVSFLCVRAIPSGLLEGLTLAAMPDEEMIRLHREMKQMVKPLRIDRQMRRLTASVRANPGVRKAFGFRNKPETGDKG
ncbi:hypothetical protein [Maliponia aquimaris]|uniref:Uncharacterized protein n=1 Tax=Maliponia aquimaris TaxID=1673631 RepID=A0A238KVD0_9RHOB|nr:hypothetical protein [Maliponia aquimaris]SMX46667.1 hypothetical protein MAA8898_03477 [Maliponia aquimaris]